MERDVVQDATSSAIGYFNDGRKSIVNLFTKLNINPGRSTAAACSHQDQKRIIGSLMKSSKSSAQSHKKRLSRETERG